jgi:small subunit ribosomal protein S1
MSWGRVKHPSEMLKVGQELDVMVLDVDKEKERISLGLKQTTENPWNTIAEQFPVGARVKGKVVNPVNYYFMDLSAEEYDQMIELAANQGKVFD